MHMSDALLSPLTGIAMCALSTGMIAYSSGRIGKEELEKRAPLIGVMASFVFAAQMINFTIPGTGSSGHLGGGVLLAVLLGPYASFLAISSVILVQALFFADGGLLALGCNIFNMGFFPAFIAYPFIYRKIAGSSPDAGKESIAIMAASVFSLQAGAFSVVLESVASGVSSLPFSAFAAVMQSVHLAIGVVEGVATAGIVAFIRKASPRMLQFHPKPLPLREFPFKNALFCLSLITMLAAAGVISWFSSAKPDGLEWSIQKITGREAPDSKNGRFHTFFEKMQKKTVFLPGYDFDATESAEARMKTESSRAGGMLSAVAGGIITLLTVFLAGFLLRKFTGGKAG